MRLNISPNSTIVGNVELHELARVTELDAGHSVAENKSGTNSSGTVNSATGHKNLPISRDSLLAIESQIAIIIPCKDEEQDILEGVLRGIPHDCLIIVVSNSKPANFDAECELLAEFCESAQRPGIAVHQQNEGLAKAFHTAGMSELVNEVGPCSGQEKSTWRVRNGKGEGMIIGTAIAELAGKNFVGFIDADNLVTGAVNEYCKVYVAGLHYALHCAEGNDTESTTPPHAMVRIKWNSKPKVKDNKLVFEKSGRSSRVVNEWMNRLLDDLTGSDTPGETIQTGNAGEHAMSIDLAMKFRFATGYAVEPFQLIDAWERLGVETPVGDQPLDISGLTSFDTIQENHETGIGREYTPPISNRSSFSEPIPHSSPRPVTPPDTPPSEVQQKIRILQVETRNPHFHDTSKGNGHIEKMQAEGLSTMYHSSLTSPELKEELRIYMKKNLSAVAGADGVPAELRTYPPMETMDFEIFGKMVKKDDNILQVFGDLEGTVLI
jgi:mannosyl-3-phosphoglycerate synthase